MGLPLNEVEMAETNLVLSSRTCWMQYPDFLAPREGVLGSAELPQPGTASLVLVFPSPGRVGVDQESGENQAKLGMGLVPHLWEVTQTPCCFSPLHESQFFMPNLSIPFSHLISYQ